MSNYPPYQDPYSSGLQPTMPAYRRQFYMLPEQPKPPKPTLFSKKQQLIINIAALIAVLVFCIICIMYTYKNTASPKLIMSTVVVTKLTVIAMPTSHAIRISKSMSSSSPTTDPSPTSMAMPTSESNAAPASIAAPVSRGDVPPAQATNQPRPTQVQTVPIATPTAVQTTPTPTTVPTVVPTPTATTEPVQQPTEAPSPIATSAPTPVATGSH